MDGRVQDEKLKLLCYVDVSKARQWVMHWPQVIVVCKHFRQVALLWKERGHIAVWVWQVVLNTNIKFLFLCFSLAPAYLPQLDTTSSFWGLHNKTLYFISKVIHLLYHFHIGQKKTLTPDHIQWEKVQSKFIPGSNDSAVVMVPSSSDRQ